jgi:hypothetical protein
MDRYAFLLVAMSMEEAKATLGFPPDSRPSAGDIKSAYRQKALEAHPDRGGSDEAMKALNAAKDILEGKQRPSYDRSAPDPAYGGGGGTGTWTPPERKEVTFDEAKAKAGIPFTSIDWLFVTPYQRGKGWMSDESTLSDRYFVAYGRKDKKHYFVVAHHHERAEYYVGATHNDNIWTIEALDYPIRNEEKESQNPAWLYRNVVKALKGAGFKGKFNSKVLNAEDWKFKSRLPTGSATSIKHWLVNSGQVSGDAASVANRKHVIEIKVESTRDDNKSGFYPEPKARHNFWDGKYWGEYWKVTLIINGKPFTLSKDDTQKFLGARYKGKSLTNAIFGDYIYGSKTKQLTRLRAAKQYLEWMTTRFDDLPKEAMDVLKAVLEQKGGK